MKSNYRSSSQCRLQFVCCPSRASHTGQHAQVKITHSKAHSVCTAPQKVAAHVGSSLGFRTELQTSTDSSLEVVQKENQWLQKTR